MFCLKKSISCTVVLDFAMLNSWGPEVSPVFKIFCGSIIMCAWKVSTSVISRLNVPDVPTLSAPDLAVVVHFKVQVTAFSTPTWFSASAVGAPKKTAKTETVRIKRGEWRARTLKLSHHEVRGGVRCARCGVPRNQTDRT